MLITRSRSITGQSLSAVARLVALKIPLPVTQHLGDVIYFVINHKFSGGEYPIFVSIYEKRQLQVNFYLMWNSSVGIAN